MRSFPVTRVRSLRCHSGKPIPECAIGSASRAGSLILNMAPFSPRGSDVLSTHAGTVVAEGAQMENEPIQRKSKRVRLLLDSRIELTDEELKIGLSSSTGIQLSQFQQRARANYVQEQEALKREVAQKRFDKENSKRIEEMIYGVPRGGLCSI